MDIVLLDHLLGLAARRRRNTRGIPRHQLDLATCHHVVALFQIHDERAFHIDAPGSERPGLDRQKADADRAVGRARAVGRNDARQANSRNPRCKLATRNSHHVLPEMLNLVPIDWWFRSMLAPWDHRNHDVANALLVYMERGCACEQPLRPIARIIVQEWPTSQ